MGMSPSFNSTSTTSNVMQAGQPSDRVLAVLLPNAAQQLPSAAPLIDIDHHVQQVVLAGHKLNSPDPRYQEDHLRSVLPGLLTEAYGVLDTYARQPSNVDQTLLLQALRFLQWLVEQHCVANDLPFAHAPPRARRRLVC
jgi:hypothetical protein